MKKKGECLFYFSVKRGMLKMIIFFGIKWGYEHKFMQCDDNVSIYKATIYSVCGAIVASSFRWIALLLLVHCCVC